MKVLSLLQPWATLVAIGAKRIETRSWATRYRGPLAIHASAKLPKGFEQLSHQSPFREALSQIPLLFLPTDCVRSRPARPVPLGSILCVCDLVDCVQITADNAPDEPEQSFGDYTPGRYAWVLQNVRALPSPIPAKGALGLWTPTPDVAELLERFYKERVG